MLAEATSAPPAVARARKSRRERLTGGSAPSPLLAAPFVAAAAPRGTAPSAAAAPPLLAAPFVAAAAPLPVALAGAVGSALPSAEPPLAIAPSAAGSFDASPTATLA